jgi:hypothetical protein
MTTLTALYVRMWKKMIMVITLSFLGLEAPDLLFSRRRWHRPWPPSQLFTQERRIGGHGHPLLLLVGRAKLLF